MQVRRVSRRTTRISLAYRQTAEGLVVIIEDDGIGIPPEEKHIIFERGYGKHTGLGPFLSAEILSITGIAVTESVAPGNGVRFEIYVPNGAFRVMSP